MECSTNLPQAAFFSAEEKVQLISGNCPRHITNFTTYYGIGLVTLGGFFCSFVVVCMGCILAISRKLEHL